MDNYYDSSRTEMMQLIDRDYKKILEIGCGKGNFRSNFPKDIEYWGVEPCVDAGSSAKEKLDRVLIGTYDEFIEDIPENYFDLIVCNDVIEHMIDHDSFFNSIKTKMTRNGALVASIPNVRYVTNLYKLLIDKDWQYTDHGILDRTHLRWFTKKSLSRTVIKHDFNIKKIKGINGAIFYKKSLIHRVIQNITIFILGKDTEFLNYIIHLEKVNNK